MNAHQELSRAERLCLMVLDDGQWHRGKRWQETGYVLATTAAALYRRGFAEREGASRTARPTNPGYQYRITEAGRAALDAARRNRAGGPPPR